MTDTGKLTTFFRLLTEESSIKIPKVQRDYAYGRDDDKARSILTGMLDSMHSAMVEDRREIFDFVYGGPYAKDDEGQAGMIPLDGQQRLTTLFLLHFYASLSAKDNAGTPVDVSILKGFSYETRQSANDFRLKLVTDIRQRIIDSGYPESDKTIKRLIEDDAEYSPAYIYDPTIQSMLVVLDEIEKRFRDFRNLWEALTNRDNLCFYHITLDRFGLTDELYIKMNSRGKKLTPFEIFKADFIEDVKRFCPEKSEELARKLDVEWMDMVWSQFPENPKEADKGYLHLLDNVIRMARNRTGQVLTGPHSVLSSAEELSITEDILDFMHSVYSNAGFRNWWGQYFYNDKNVTGLPDRIRLFSIDSPLFETAMREQLTVPQTILFMAVYLAHKNSLDFDTAFRRLRTVRNLTRANQRANYAHTTHLPVFISDTERFMTEEALPASSDSHFVGTSLEEERLKLSLSQTAYKAMLRFENHAVLDASLALFINEYLKPLSSDCQTLFNELERFESIFSDNCRNKEAFEMIRVSMLDSEVDYWQSPTNNDKDDVKRRFFFHSPKDYNAFFFRNRTRANQSGILEMLRKTRNPDGLKNGDEKCLGFAIDDWRYYMAKYTASNNPDTASGCYGWKDINNRPLEVFILNSTYFEDWNLAWSMMLNILFDAIKDNFTLRWDSHQRPIDISDLSAFIDFRQEGWTIAPINLSQKGTLEEHLSVHGAVWDDERGHFLLPHNPSGKADYIETITSILPEIPITDMQGQEKAQRS